MLKFTKYVDSSIFSPHGYNSKIKNTTKEELAEIKLILALVPHPSEFSLIKS